MHDDLTREELEALRGLWDRRVEEGRVTPETLLVDDDPDTLDELGELIRAEGVVCHVALHADEAFDLLERHPNIRIVVSDLLMPGIDGLEMIRLIKARYPEVNRYMMISAHGTMRDVQDAMHEDVLEFLDKPLNEELFLSRFRRVLWTVVRELR